MHQAAAKFEVLPSREGLASHRGAASVGTHHLGQTLRTVYEGSVDKQPIPDSQVDLLLRLRQKERDLRRSA